MNVLAYAIEQDGKKLLLKCSDNRELITLDVNEAIDYLMKPCDYAVCYHVDEFAETFKSLLNRELLEELESTERIRKLPDKRKIFYATGRQFTVGHGWDNERDIYGLHRYTDEQITDVNELYDLWVKVAEAYSYFGCEPTKLSSPVGVYEPQLDKIKFTRACDLPETAYDLINELQDVAWEEWREVYKLGHWQADEVTDMDISSAYPSFIAKLPDLTNAKFYESDVLPERYTWGLLKGTLNITADYTYLDVGTYEKKITTGQLKQIYKYGWGTFDMEHGWFIDIPKGYRKPFDTLMRLLYQTKQNENELVKKIAKAISVGIGGKFNSIYGDKPSKSYNPIYAKMITSGCQMAIAEFIWDNSLQDRLISVLVDGTLFEGDIDIQMEEGMGNWRKEPKSPFLVLSLLYQWGNSKHPDGNYYEDAVRMFQENPDECVYGDIDINLLEYDRKFDELPKCGGDILNRRYTSRPEEIGIV